MKVTGYLPPSKKEQADGCGQRCVILDVVVSSISYGHDLHINCYFNKVSSSHLHTSLYTTLQQVNCYLLFGFTTNVFAMTWGLWENARSRGNYQVISLTSSIFLSWTWGRCGCGEECGLHIMLNSRIGEEQLGLLRTEVIPVVWVVSWLVSSYYLYHVTAWASPG